MPRFKVPPIPSSEITSESAFVSRRRFVGAAMALPLAGAAPRALAGDTWTGPDGEALTPEAIVTGYNNFYEFGLDKTDPAEYAHEMTVDPWRVEVSGECARPGDYAYEDVIKGLTVEDRVYRFRCVEAWSMVVPWQGIPLADVLARFEPTGDARFVEFTTLHRPAEMRGQRSVFSSIDWPYVEGLRLDEAMHPLTIMAVGVYGRDLPNQNGAPWRLVVPWKYGFKSIKSVVKIRFTRRQPRNTWNLTAPDEYGFFANVNPQVDHPRWSQATERRLPSTLFSPNRRDTLMFNGYAEQVASLYAGMDLRRHF